MVAFNSRSFPRSATDKTSPARFPTPSATTRLKEPREGAPRTLGHQKVPRGQRLRKYLLIYGPSRFTAQARTTWGPRDYGPCRGIISAENNHLFGTLWNTREKGVLDRTKACMVLGLKPMGKPSTNKIPYKFWAEPRPCMVLGLKPMGKPSTNKISYKFWTDPRPCVVLGLKPMGRLSTKKRNIRSFGQNQGLVWSSDSNRLGNQLLG